MVGRGIRAAALIAALAACQSAPAETRGTHWRCAEGQTFVTQSRDLGSIVLILDDRRIEMRQESARIMTRELRVDRYHAEGLTFVRNVRTEPPFTMTATLTGAAQPYVGCVEVR